MFIRLLVIVMVVMSEAELQDTSSGNQKTCSAVLHTSSKIDELRSIVSNYLEMVNIELRNTKHQVEELKVAVTEKQESVSSDHEIVTSELRNTSRQLEDARRHMDELQVSVTGNQEMVSSEQEDTRRKVDDLQVEVRDMKQHLVQLQVSVSTIVSLLKVSSTLSKDCSWILQRGVLMSGVYTVQPLDSGQAFQVYCDMETDGGGWTVFQRRQDGSVDFYRDFASYSRGFGDLEGEFWLGNDNLHRLTAQGEYELRVDLSDFENMTAYAFYGSFSIADVSDNYRLTLENYSGTAGAALLYNSNQPFTTKDRHNDDSFTNCAESSHGAWWYKNCYSSNLNGRYVNEAVSNNMQGIVWTGFSRYRTLKTTEMKIRSKV